MPRQVKVDYEEALDWIMSFWEPGRSKEQERALRPLKVGRMRALLDRLGSPDRQFPSMLVAGTKGKGSTAAFISEGLRAGGYRVGRYTQPHLVDWRERSWVDGSLIETHEVVALVERIRPVVEQSGDLAEGLTTYEIGTALTLLYFAARQVEIAVLEIGVGGRLDALNAVDPVMSVVTSISLDHTDVLGSTLAEIAAEKAGIFRRGKAAVSSPQHPEAEEAIRHAAATVGAHLYLVGADWRWTPGGEADSVDVLGPRGGLEGLRIALLGNHQRDNATTAVAALQLLGDLGFPVRPDAIRRGLAGVEWPGRIQMLRRDPMVVVDAAHNVDSVRRLVETVQSRFRYGKLLLVFGASADKDVAGMARWLGPAADRVVLTSSGHRRAAPGESLASEFGRYAPAEVVADPASAFGRALELAGPEDLVLITGSVFLAGRAIELLGAQQP